MESHINRTFTETSIRAASLQACAGCVVDRENLRQVANKYQQLLAEETSRTARLEAQVNQLSVRLVEERCYRATADEEIEALDGDIGILKAHNDTTEEILGQVTAERDNLQQTNVYLRRRNAQLWQQNAQLQEKLRLEKSLVSCFRGQSDRYSNQVDEETRAHDETCRAFGRYRAVATGLLTVAGVDTLELDTLELHHDNGRSAAVRYTHNPPHQNVRPQVGATGALGVRSYAEGREARHECSGVEDADMRSTMAVYGSVRSDDLATESDESKAYESEDKESMRSDDELLESEYNSADDGAVTHPAGDEIELEQEDYRLRSPSVDPAGVELADAPSETSSSFVEQANDSSEGELVEASEEMLLEHAEDYVEAGEEPWTTSL